MKARIIMLLIIMIGQLAAILAPLRAMYAIIRGDIPRAMEIAKGYDLLGNVVLNGNAGEYISTRAHIARAEGKLWGCILCDTLDAMVRNHCLNSPILKDINEHKK